MQTQLEIEAGVQQIEVVLESRSDAAVAGRVLDPNGTPLADEPVVLFHLFSTNSFSIRLDESRARTGHDGRFRFEGLLPGRYRADLAEDDEREVVGSVEFVLGASESHDELTLVAAEAVSISGWVDLGGRAPGDFIVALVDADTAEDVAQTSLEDSGEFRFHQLFPHRFDLVLWRGDREIDRRSLGRGGASAVTLVATD